MLLAALTCLIVGVSDGDTLTARCPTQDVQRPYQQVRIRLAEIDAPESSQPFGKRSKEHLSGLCYQAEAVIRPTTMDRYGRTVARVECKGVDANLEMVKAGLAWAFTKYQTDPAFPRPNCTRAPIASACGPSPVTCRRGTFDTRLSNSWPTPTAATPANVVDDFG